MLELWLVRHAESVGNLDGSDADTELSPRGRAQATQLGLTLRSVELDHIWSSPLLRARETAQLALPQLHLAVDERLTELRSPARVEFVDPTALGPEELRRFLAARQRLPEESGLEFMSRVRAWIADLPATGRVIAFTHFGVVREITSALLGFRNAPTTVAHASVCRLELREGAARLVTTD